MAGLELLAGGCFASPVIQSVVQRAQIYLGDNYEVQKNTRKLVEELTTQLVNIKATIDDAERRMINSPDLRNRLRMLKEAVYEADDVLDNMEAESIKKKIQGNKVSDFAASSLSGFGKMFIPNDNHKSLKKVIDKVMAISAEVRNLLNLVNTSDNFVPNNDEISDEREAISGSFKEVVMYGRHEESNIILKMILDPESGSNLYGESGPCRDGQGRQNYNYHGLLVLPITGMGGVGKTALAQTVYNNPEVQRTFEAKAWISISYNLDVKLVMHKLIHSLRGYSRLDGMTLEDSSMNLSSIIVGARFLVVLDDMCEKIENQWDDLYTTLSQGAPGSVVLITTQNQAFANRVGTFGHVELTPLVWEVFWELFKHFAFGNKEIPEKKRSLLEKIGTEIASKLHGLPLAAKIIGNILSRNIDDMDEWRRISRSEWWDMPEDEDSSKILPYIGVSYQHLDPSLRKCFAYCSLFPRNSLIEKDRLVQIWIAQNFIPHDRNGAREMEDVGGKWFDKLVAMSIFQPAGDNKGYVMPSLMHDLAVIVSSDECFFLSDKSQKIPESVRHLAVDPKDVEVVEKIRKHKKLRSFLYFGLSQVDGIDLAINNTLHELDKLRVLDLSYLHMETKKPPAAIQKMPHLRFLNLSSTGIKNLTQSRFDNYHLQSLHIQECQLIKLPRSINKLINLRHLNADAETIALISGIGKLTNLQELDEYRVRKKEGNKITELKHLRELTGHLRIVNCENIESKAEAVQARLVEKKNLLSIEISWSSAPKEADIDLEILEGLKPSENIKELTINGYMGTSFPFWMSEISHFLNLQTIRLISCINIEVLRFPRQPPPLYTLEIVDNLSLREAHLHCFSASLKALKIVGCHNLNSLAESLPHLTSLALLHVVNCRLSLSLNIIGLTLLEELMLTDCPELSIEGDLQSLRHLKRLDISHVPFIRSFGRTIKKPQRSVSTSGLESGEIGGGPDKQIVYGHQDVYQTDSDFENASSDGEGNFEMGVEYCEDPIVQQRGQSDSIQNSVDVDGQKDRKLLLELQESSNSECANKNTDMVGNKQSGDASSETDKLPVAVREFLFGFLFACFRPRRKEISPPSVRPNQLINSVNSLSSIDVSSSSQKFLPAVPHRVPPSPSRFTLSPQQNRFGSVQFTINQIIRATHNFSDSFKLGEGGFGTVYRAVLPDGRVVAVKRAEKEHFQGLRDEFSNEVELLTKIDYINLVRLLGYIDKGNERIIITEYVSNGTLREHLDGQLGKILDFNQRLQIAIDIAHALTYLHLCAEKTIIHQDVNSSNILLTESYRAKVSDFGFAKSGPSDTERTHISSKLKGTSGYVDPEYLRTFQLSPKSDVFSFGILLIEILSGRHPVELKRNPDERITVRWAFKKFNEGNLPEILDPLLEERVDNELISSFLNVAFQCAAPTQDDRPTMKEVLEQLWTINTGC